MKSPTLLRTAVIFAGSFLGGLTAVALVAPTLAGAQPRAGGIPGPAPIPVAAPEQRITLPSQGLVYVDSNNREVLRIRPNGRVEMVDGAGKVTTLTAGAVTVSRQDGSSTDSTSLEGDGLESRAQASGGLGVGGANANVARIGATPKGSMKAGVTTVIGGRTWSSP